jgi:ubiquinone/menaquinone biosynthesis C-methylase UbiE
MTMTSEQIFEYWTNQAKKYKYSPAASWSDSNAIQLEVNVISTYLKDKDHILDIGCANGFSTIRLANLKNIQIKGIDYVPEMIKYAQLRLIEQPNLLQRVVFDLGNILDLRDADNVYDTVIIIRVIINLQNWEDQKRGIRESIRILKSGGLLLMSEATIQGWLKLNALRREWGLSDIPQPEFNLYLDQDRITQEFSDSLELIHIDNFASSYFVGTRFLKPLLAKIGSKRPRPGIVTDPNTEINKWFAQWPAVGDYGTQKLFVFKKKMGF